MSEQLRPPLKENYVYTPYFHALSYGSESDEDIYDKIIFYDGGKTDNDNEIIYDGGGVGGYDDSEEG